MLSSLGWTADCSLLLLTPLWTQGNNKLQGGVPDITALTSLITMSLCQNALSGTLPQVLQPLMTHWMLPKPLSSDSGLQADAADATPLQRCCTCCLCSHGALPPATPITACPFIALNIMSRSAREASAKTELAGRIACECYEGAMGEPHLHVIVCQARHTMPGPYAVNPQPCRRTGHPCRSCRASTTLETC